MTSSTPISKQDLRIFACIVSGGFFVVGVLSWYRHRFEPLPTFASACWTIGAIILALGLVAPGVLRPFHRFWLALGHVLGFINTRIILGLTFFGLFTSFGWFSRRVFGRDPLQLAKAPKTYWIKREQKVSDHKRMF